MISALKVENTKRMEQWRRNFLQLPIPTVDMATML
jgi:hypothetical protein